jgi:hypothetical protein
LLVRCPSVWTSSLDRVGVFDWQSGIGLSVISDTSACDLGWPILFPPRSLKRHPCNCRYVSLVFWFVYNNHTSVVILSANLGSLRCVNPSLKFFWLERPIMADLWLDATWHFYFPFTKHENKSTSRKGRERLFPKTWTLIWSYSMFNLPR